MVKKVIVETWVAHDGTKFPTKSEAQGYELEARVYELLNAEKVPESGLTKGSIASLLVTRAEDWKALFDAVFEDEDVPYADD